LKCGLFLIRIGAVLIIFTMDKITMDTGLQCLVALAGFHQLPADAAQISHQFAIPGQPLGNTEILRAAKALTFKAKLFTFPLAKLIGSSLPAIARTKADLPPKT
jgi:subfamily B ATP-binding cassette protein HlyB/CyaB